MEGREWGGDERGRALARAASEGDLSGDRGRNRSTAGWTESEDALGYSDGEWGSGLGRNRSGRGVSAVWGEVGRQGQEETQAGNARRARGGVSTGVWRLSKVWARDFSPWMKSWHCYRGNSRHRRMKS